MTATVVELRGRTIRRGRAAGEALVTAQPISFYGGVDPSSGVIVEQGHELEGRSIAGSVLVFPTGKGSTVGSYALYRLARNRVAPKALVLRECETVVAVGAIISDIPCVDHIDIRRIRTGDRVDVRASEGRVLRQAPPAEAPRRRGRS
jgi:uncharacterized protein